MAKRRKRQPKSAYLKRAKYMYDPYSPYALKTRGQKTINLSGLIRDPVTKQLYDAGTPKTITHGKRGLTIARVEIPRIAAGLRQEAVEALELTPRGRLREWNHVLYSPKELKPDYSIELFFEGRKWVWVERTLVIERHSRTYASKELAEQAFRNRIWWEDVYPIK